MQQKNVFLLLALSGSVLIVMLVSTLLFIPHTGALQANIVAANPLPPEVVIQQPQQTVYTTREPAEILKTIQKYVSNNNPDEAKKLYDELYMTQKYHDLKAMGGEISGGF